MLSEIKAASAVLWKDHKYLKIIFIFLTGFVLFEEMVVFFIDKPTLTTIIKSGLEPQHFPEILLCPDPALDLSVLLPRGYQDGYHYQIGVTGNDTHYEYYRWSGNLSENVEDIVNDVSVLRSEEDCPMTFVWWNDDEKLKYEVVNTTLTRALFPNHRCCRVLKSDNVRSKVMKGVEVRYEEEKYKGKLLNSWKMMMFDEKVYSVFQHNTETMFGESITSSLGSQGTNYYTIKLKQEVYLEETPQYPCIDYQVAGEFDKCLEKEKIEQISRYLNCTPPWMTDNKELWCGLDPVGTEEIMDTTYFLFEEILVGQTESVKCSVPCTKTNYIVNKIGFERKNGRAGIFVIFDNVIEKTVSELKIGPKTLLTRIGGIIGVGKNLLWLLVFLFTSIGSGMTLLGNKCGRKTSSSSSSSESSNMKV